jgi:hypothetical protein
MAQQTINVGTAPNDGTGDTLKTSFTKCNANFTELYNGAAGLPYVLKAGDTMTGALNVIPTAGADGVQISGATTQGRIVATGASADIGLVLTSKGNGSLTFYNDSFARFCANFTSAPGSDTFVGFTGNAGYSSISNNPAGNPFIFYSNVSPNVLIISSGSAPNFAAGQNFTIAMAAAFSVVNPSANPMTGTYVAITVSMTGAGALTWGSNFKGLAAYTQSAWTTGTMRDHLVFRWSGTTYDLVGVAKGINQ